MNDTKISTVIDKADISDGMTGGCVSFAVALDIVFGADVFPCSFDPFDDSKPLHATAVINGTVYDADGAHGSDFKYVQDWWSGLKPTDFEAVQVAAENCNEPIEAVFNKYLEDEAYEVFETSSILYHLGANKTQVKEYVSALESEIPNS